MNTCRTDHEPLEYTMPRAELHRLLIASQLPKDPYHYDFHDTPTTLADVLGLTVFAAGMLALLGYGLMWLLR